MVAEKVLEHNEFVPKLMRALKVLKKDELADALTVLCWLASADKIVVDSIEENKVAKLMRCSETRRLSGKKITLARVFLRFIAKETRCDAVACVDRRPAWRNLNPPGED